MPAAPETGKHGPLQQSLVGGVRALLESSQERGEFPQLPKVGGGGVRTGQTRVRGAGTAEDPETRGAGQQPSQNGRRKED